ncbi:uncharacterized protein HMPREF1541_08090 [Cyphellophora europaea CBS 101466]|uniref:Uncharacterized protein n=1 Tax=Cyphellophora europaea (strain CBS 101466) TaxID=1220924 RepID=W2RLA2_CYPE1|nr:uncharacterized protein HMPREF1541_08090 [Cyphellophora europaea CBS 101466]ETN37100.1 hypothetical protein HMPREF1541_08090 [Cyphellophora europaea CBS 101466]
MDYDDSEEERSLPSNADPTDAVDVLKTELDNDEDTQDSTSAFRSEENRPVPSLTSPGRIRKRSNEEIYKKSQLPVFSTTPQKTPPKAVAFQYRAASEPQTSKSLFGQSFEKTGFSKLRNVMTASSPPPSTGLTIIDEGTSQVSMHDVGSAHKSFIDEIEAFEKELKDEFDTFERSLDSRDPSADLGKLDWDELEERFAREIDPIIKEEDKVRAELGARLQQFLLWMQVSGEQEGERAIKRLRTRTAFVQHSETKLDEKQEHYRKVVEAFEKAMQLLSA